MLLNLVKFIVRLFFTIFYKVKVVGLENIPLDGPVVIACNHKSNFDPPLAGCYVGLKRDPIYFIKKELMSVPVIGWLFKRFGFIPVDRKRLGGDLHAIKSALKVIQKDKALFIFPEGTRSKTGKPLKPKAGIGFMLWHCQAQVVPIKVFNTENLPFTRHLSVIIGKPFTLQAEPNKEPKEQYQDFADKVMQEINKLKETEETHFIS